MPRPFSRVTVALAALALAGASLVTASTGWASTTSTSARHRPPATVEPPISTGLIASPLAMPHPVLAADGRRHLVYELLLVNVASIAVTVDRVQAVDPRTGRVLQVLEGDGVAAVMAPFAAAPGSTLRPGGSGTLLLDATLPKHARVPATLAHDFSLTYATGQGEPAEERSGVTKVARDRAVVIGRPLKGAGWVDVNGCCANANGHRSAVNPINGALWVAERFAIDFVRLSPDGRLVTGDPEQNASYPGYGADVVSAAPGVVVDVLDGLPDNVPVGSIPEFTLETIGGNYVVVDIGGGRFAYYAHFQPGSITVELGDRVREGEVLGLVGNSGNSDAPHLHFQVMDSPSPLASDGLPYEFRKFFSPGMVANFDEVAAGEPAVLDPALSGRHVRQIPMEGQVLTFPRSG